MKDKLTKMAKRLSDLSERVSKLEEHSHPPVEKKYDPELTYAVQVRILKVVEELTKRIEALENKNEK